MKWLSDNGFRGVTLADAIAARAGRLSGQAGGAGGAAKGMKAFTLTFDHGYADNFRNALPVLKEHRIPAHFFLVTDLIDTQEFLKLPEITATDPARDRLMTWDEVLSLKERDFVSAARALGASEPRVILRHVLPNAAGPILVQATGALGGAVLAESTLSFLGLGPGGAASWGALLDQGASLVIRFPHVALASGGAIALTVLGFHLTGDWLAQRLTRR